MKTFQQHSQQFSSLTLDRLENARDNEMRGVGDKDPLVEKLKMQV